MSKKFGLDKYYTPDDIVEKVVLLTKETVGSDFDLVVEPSAGGGAFIEHINNNFSGEKLFLDLEPTNDNIVQQDYLEYTPRVDGKILVLGNPPFGTRNNLSVKFFKKSVNFASVIAFIQPISQLDNTRKMYEFDLLKSIDLGDVCFYNQHGDTRNVKCCFNIYKRPNCGILNRMRKYKFEEVMVRDFANGRSKDEKSLGSIFVSICAWGASLGKVCKPKTYAQELHIYSENEEILKFVSEFDWTSVCSRTASPALYVWRVYEVLLEHFELTELS